MKRNMGVVDRVIRLALALLVLVLYLTGQLSTTAAVVLGVLAVIFVATSVAGLCPLYLPFGISTRRKASS